ncbi:MAG: hypothetical protein HXY44_00910 [Syntrophaceae bacterium]|nr:hypothetical protein [Syntrophaceae bacterium]
MPHPILALVTFFMAISCGYAQPLFEVERESYCQSIRDREPVRPFKEIAEMKKGEGLFLWMEIKAGQRALTMLEAKGQMPIYHAWATEKGVVDVIDIGMAKERWMELAEAIKKQYKHLGFFTWRTQSFKRHLKEGRWYVSILDANKKPVRKVGSGSDAFRPEIVIRIIP